MRDYELKRGHWKNIDGEKLVHLMQDVFQDNPRKEGTGWIIENFGAISKLYVEQLGKTHLRVDTHMNPNVALEEQQKTMRAWNDFLELSTGYSAKERGKRSQKGAKAGADDVPDA